MIKIISGGQTGADEAALFAAKAFGLETGGWMPKGFKTLMGNKPQFATLYGMKEHSSSNYADRTWDNVSEADATVRFATVWGSAGERCTLNAIKRYDKPWWDINPITDLVELHKTPEELALWIDINKWKVINIAGNSERTSPGIFQLVVEYLAKTFTHLGYKNANVSTVS